MKEYLAPLELFVEVETPCIVGARTDDVVFRWLTSTEGFVGRFAQRYPERLMPGLKGAPCRVALAVERQPGDTLAECSLRLSVQTPLEVQEALVRFPYYGDAAHGAHDVMQLMIAVNNASAELFMACAHTMPPKSPVNAY